MGERKGDEQRLCDLLAAFHIRLTRHRRKGQIALRLGFAEEARECTSSVVKIADLVIPTQAGLLRPGCAERIGGARGNVPRKQGKSLT